MRVSREDAAKNRERVVRTASRLFRKQGYDGVGIAELMQAAGLTNGAFYKQFDSKEALIAEATAYALDENAETWQGIIEHAGGDPLGAFARSYLSDAHVRRRDRGCAFAALAAEAPRHGDNVRKSFDAGLGKAIAALSTAIATMSREDGETIGAGNTDRAMAIRQLCQLVGALTLARATDDKALADEIINAAMEVSGEA